MITIGGVVVTPLFFYPWKCGKGFPRTGAFSPRSAPAACGRRCLFSSRGERWESPDRGIITNLLYPMRGVFRDPGSWRQAVGIDARRASCLHPKGCKHLEPIDRLTGRSPASRLSRPFLSDRSGAAPERLFARCDGGPVGSPSAADKKPPPGA